MKCSKETQMKIMGGKTTNLEFSENALKVVAKRYLQKNENGEIIETPEEMFMRVAKRLAKIEERYGKTEEEVNKITNSFYEIMSNFEAIPGGRTLANMGRSNYEMMVPNCIVLHIEDTIEEIFGTLKDAVIIQKHGGGIGFPLHLLRPAGSKTKTTEGCSSGPISFLYCYNACFGVIKQQNRHGANMAVMRVDHPDILEFIHCKDKEGNLVNFNVSVGLTDEFMEAVINNDKKVWMCNFKGKLYKPRIIKRDYRLAFQESEEVDLTARDIMDEIVNSAWTLGEPGIVFLDTVNKTNTLPGLGILQSCNPCGEQFLHDSDVCNLGSINLEKFYIPNIKHKEDWKIKINWNRLKKVVHLFIRLLDNVVDATTFPIERLTNGPFKDNRRVGMGIMGFADLLILLRVGYGTKLSITIVEEIMKYIDEEAWNMSRLLAKEKGTFKNYDKSVFISRGDLVRNAAVTNVAPTGTISMMIDVSGGIEPYFALAYNYSNILDQKERFYYINKHLQPFLDEYGINQKHIIEQIIAQGSLQNIPEIPEKLKRIFLTSMDISPDQHIMVQHAFQKHVTNACSKTINFNESASHDDIFNAFIKAWNLNIKGLTVYRNNCRQFQVLNLNSTPSHLKGESTNNDDDSKKKVRSSPQCPECGENMVATESCFQCRKCAVSICSL